MNPQRTGVTETDPRTGESWEKLLAEYRLNDIRERDDDGYDVESVSGNTYRVMSHTRLDEMGSMYFTWSCTCPARKRCRHIDAVQQMRWAEAAASEDYDGMDIMEREQ